MKKVITIAIALMMIFALTACGGKSNVSETAKMLEETYGLNGPSQTEDDAWYWDDTTLSEANDPLNWAEDYWNEYGGDGRVLWVLNYANHTTTRLSNLSTDGLMLQVEQMDGTEDVAKTVNKGEAYNGTVLLSYIIFYDDDGQRRVEELSE